MACGVKESEKLQHKADMHPNLLKSGFMSA